MKGYEDKSSKSDGGKKSSGGSDQPKIQMTVMDTMPVAERVAREAKAATE